MLVHQADAVSRNMVVSLIDGETGGTLDANGESVDVSGQFVVGGVVPSLVFDLPCGVTDWNIHILANVIYDFVKANHVPGAGFGFWFDAGKLHIDIVDCLSDREEAIKLGKERGELAIFDGTTFEDIRLDA